MTIPSLSTPGLAVLLCLCGLVASGCASGGADEGPEILTQVTGSVLVDGAPTPGVSLNFVPRGSSTETGGYAVTDSEGKFVAVHRTGAPGLEPGEYVVTFSKIAMPDGSPIPEGKDAADVMAVNVLPAAYADPDNPNSPHIVTVTADKPVNVDFELKGK